MFKNPANKHIHEMPKKKTSIYIDEDLWNQWMHFILDDPRYGTTRKASEALEDAMRCYLESKNKK